MIVIRSHPRLLIALLALAVGAALALGWFTASHTMSFGGYKGTFVARYDLEGSKLDSCDTCHNADFSRNPFGQAIEDELALGNDTDTALLNIGPLDSDGDGASNIDEINALTWPGDATDSPAAGPTATDAPSPAGTATTEPSTTPTITATVTVTALPTTTPGEPPAAGGPPAADGNSLTYVLLLLGALTALLAVVVIYVAIPRRGA